MGPVPIVAGLKSAYNAYNESRVAGKDPFHDAPYAQPMIRFHWR